MSDRSGCCGTPQRVVKITSTHSVCSPVSKTPVNTPESVKLGVLDHVSAPLLIVKIPFVFSHTLDSTLLTTSLSNMLARYPLFSGRLIIDTEGDYSVALNNAGASLTLAKCTNTTLSDLLPEGMVAAPPTSTASSVKIKNSPMVVSGSPHSSYTPEDMTPFLPKVPALILGYRNKDVPLFQAQVTYLKNGGTVLGIAVPHLLADQETCRLVLKSWAENYTALDVCRIGGDNQQHEGKEKENAESSSNGSTGERDKESDATDVLPITTKPSMDSTSSSTSSSRITISNKVPFMGGEALESHATPALLTGWKSSRFEKRNWRYVPSILGRGIGNSVMAGMPVTVAYYVSAKRLEELKAEASRQIQESIVAANAAGGKDIPWISTNDALVARLRQAIADNIPGRSGKKDLQLVVDLRKRMEPALPAEALGNCSWTVAVGSDSSSNTPNLGVLAAEIRTAILELGNTTTSGTTISTTSKPTENGKNKNKNITNLDICNELRWMINNTRPGGANMPVVFQNFSNMMRTCGPILVSHWDWGGFEYNDLSFGGGPECTPVWHQPTFPKLPNCVFIVPAPCGGALVHLTLHKKLAKKLKSKCPAL